MGGVGEEDCGEACGSLMIAEMDANTKELEIKAKEQELKLQFKSAPRNVRWVLNTGWLVALLILLSYGAAAFEGYVGWGQATLRGIVQAALYLFLTFSGGAGPPAWIVVGVTRICSASFVRGDGKFVANDAPGW